MAWTVVGRSSGVVVSAAVWNQDITADIGCMICHPHKHNIVRHNVIVSRLTQAIAQRQRLGRTLRPDEAVPFCRR